VGFRYYIDPKTEQPVHTAGLITLTPQGRVSRYTFGVDYPPRDLRLTLINAGENRIGSLVDKAFLLCSQYDEHTGKYSFAIIRVLQIACGGTILILGVFIFSMIRMERARKDIENPNQTPSPST
jgi:protein SCO1/2